ncbi:MAG: M24 family metallopeptidase, partial [Nanoarchaeota archaeon]
MKKVDEIKKACEINTRIFNEIIKNFNFKTEKDIEKFILKRFKDHRVRKAYHPIVSNNYAPENPCNITELHKKPRKKKLENGFLLLDFGARYGKNASDMTRMLFIGKPTKKDKKLYKLILNCQEKCIKKVKPGANCKEIGLYAKKLLGQYNKYFCHALGHGVGYRIHQKPKISRKSPHILKEDDIITIEPGIYLNKTISIRVEDTIHVTHNRPIILTKATKKLILVNLS